MQMIQCERCGTVAVPGAAACGHCGAGLSAPKNWAPPPNATPYAASEWAHSPTPTVSDKPTLITPPPAETGSLARLISIILLALVAVAIVAKLFFVSLLFHSESPRDVRMTAAVTYSLRC